MITINELKVKRQRMRNKQTLLSYSVNIANWINRFDPKLANNFDLNLHEREFSLPSKPELKNVSNFRRTSMNMMQPHNKLLDKSSLRSSPSSKLLVLILQ